MSNDRSNRHPGNEPSPPGPTQKQATGNGQPATGNEDGGRWRGRLRIGSDIAQRLIVFATGVLRVARTLPKDVSGRHVANQIIRSATSGGANYEEARAAESSSDFTHKIGIAAKEVRETIYWLELIRSAALTCVDVEGLLREASELSAILAASIRTARGRE